VSHRKIGQHEANARVTWKSYNKFTCKCLLIHHLSLSVHRLIIGHTRGLQESTNTPKLTNGPLTWDQGHPGHFCSLFSTTYLDAARVDLFFFRLQAVPAGWFRRSSTACLPRISLGYYKTNSRRPVGTEVLAVVSLGGEVTAPRAKGIGE
jgi:hypothetical protein